MYTLLAKESRKRLDSGMINKILIQVKKKPNLFGALLYTLSAKESGKKPEL